MKKLVAVLILASLLAGGAFAQLMFGVTGDLHMDTAMSSQAIIDQFQSGDNIFYGPFVEIVFGKLGIGVAGTFSFWSDPLLAMDMMTYDVAGYLSYHLFGGHAFLDPFGEIGAGYIASDYATSSQDPDPNNPMSASVFWYGALGLGINLGPLGVFGKLAYNNALKYQLDMMDNSGNKMLDANGATKVPYYGTYDPVTNTFTEYVPAMRFTIGAKIIL
jgi:hypothetical protein